MSDNNGQIIFYSSPEGKIKIDVLFEGDTVWLTQKKLAELFDIKIPTINYHLKDIFKKGELVEEAVIRKTLITAEDNKSYQTNLYNLDAIISIGYRVNSARATQFRIWATNTLRDFIIKGFVLDDARLKNGSRFGKDYFDELLVRIREIRASERRFYQKLTDIYAQCSIDYDPQDQVTDMFYKMVQNKLHWAVTGQTAAEIIASRADAKKLNMGLKTWKDSPNGKIQKSDISIAKNYHNEKEISLLNRIVVMYLDYAENQANKHIPMTMKDWVGKLNAFLNFNEYEVLENAGQVTSQIAKELAEKEFEKYRIVQDLNFFSDFDRSLMDSSINNKEMDSSNTYVEL